jgi:hypothetical protein
MGRRVNKTVARTLEREGESLSKLLRVAGEFEPIALNFNERDFHSSEIIRHAKRKPRKNTNAVYSCADMALAHETSALDDT